MPLGLAALNPSLPVCDVPDGEIEARAVVDQVKHRLIENQSDIHADLLGQLTTKRLLGPLPNLDMATWEVPGVGIPSPCWPTMALKHAVGAMEDGCSDTVDARLPA